MPITKTIIPKVFQNLAFPAARKSPRIKNCKRPNIKSIWGRLQFLIPGVLARSKCQLLNHLRYIGIALFSLCLYGRSLEGLVDETWQASGATTNTSDLGLNTNWGNGIVPTGLATFSSTTGTNSLITTTGGFDPAAITFDGAAPAYTLHFTNTNSLDLTGTGVGVTNSGTNEQSFEFDSGSSLTFESGSTISTGNNNLISYTMNGTSTLTFSGGTNSTTSLGYFDLEGSGAVTLSGSSQDVYIGTLDSGTGATSSVNLGSNILHITDPTASGTVVYGVVISGTGGVSIDGGGSETIESACTYTGGTTISNDAELALVDAASLASTGTVTLTDSAIFDISALTLGTTTEIGPLISVDGGTTVNLGENSLTINESINTKFSGMFTNTGMVGAPILHGSTTSGAVLTINGSGILNLDGNSAQYTGTVIVNGNLAANGLLGTGGDNPATIIVNSGGTLSGVGGLGDVFVSPGGIVAPGNIGPTDIPVPTPIGTLNMYSYVNNGGKYFVNVDGNGHSDVINVFGPAALNGGVVVVSSVDGTYNFNQAYTILVAQQGVTGRYSGAVLSSLSGNPLLLKPVLTYDPDDVYLTIQTAIDRAAVTCNELAVARELDGIVNPTAVQSGLLNQIVALSVPDASRALDSLTGQQHLDDLFLTEVVNRQFIRRLYDPLRAIVTAESYDGYDYCSDSCCEKFTFWAEGGAGQTHLNNSRNARGFNLSGYEVTAGMQTTTPCDLTLGVASSYEYDRLHYKDCGSGKSKTWLIGLYGLYRPSCYYVLGDIAYGGSRNSINRRIDVGTLHDVARSHPKISQLTLYGEVGVDFNFDCLLIQPFAGLEIGSYWRQSIKESNSSGWGLVVNGRDRGTVNTRLGLHLTTNHWIDYVSVSADLAWNKRLTNPNNSLSERFLNFGDDFHINGVRLDGSSLDYALTISASPCEHWRVFAEGFGEVWNRANTYTLQGGIEYTW